MTFEGSKEPKGISIPDTDEGIFGAADDVVVIDTEIEDTPTVSGEDGENLGPGSISEKIPHNDGTVAASGNHEPRGGWVIDVPIFVEFQAEDAASVTPEGGQLLPSL